MLDTDDDRIYFAYLPRQNLETMNILDLNSKRVKIRVLKSKRLDRRLVGP
jgi:hypothetical protein